MNILLIAYYYPPINSGGTDRPVKMAKYLSRFGHNVTVLTHSYTGHALNSPPVLRIHDISHNKQRVGRYRWVWLGLRLFTEILNRAGMYWSIYAWWKRAAMRHAETILAVSKPDLILATYPPVEDLEIGLYLSQQHHIPFVADFRDGLLFEPIEIRLCHYACLQRAYAAIEHSVAQQATAIITASPPITDYFRQTYQHRQSFTIFNGFDAEDFAQTHNDLALHPKQFHLVHTGSIGGSYAGRDIAPFLRVVQQVLLDHPNLRDTLRIHFVGQLESYELRLMDELIKQGNICYHGLVERKTALAFQARADALLLVTEVSRKSMITAKLLEYLYAGKPIIALTSQTYAEVIMQQTGAGWTIHPHDEDEMYRLLYRIVTDSSFYHALTPSSEAIAEYSRLKQMERLHKILTSVLTTEQM